MILLGSKSSSKSIKSKVSDPVILRFFTLSLPKNCKGKTPILDIELRYKGDFAAYPKFFAGMTKEFKALVKQPV